MTHQKRYTAEEMLAKSNRFDWTGAETAEMLRQAAETESQVAGLVEDADAVLDSAKVIEVNFQPSDYYSVPKRYLDALHEALSKFRGEA